MKANRKVAILTSLGVIAAAAVAIPVGVVFGTQSSSAGEKAAGTVKINKSNAFEQTYYFGSEPSELPAPVLEPDGYPINPEDYGPGTITGTTISEQTEAGDGAATITFTYRPKEGKTGPIFEITYPLNVAKGTLSKGFGPNNSGTETETLDIQYGVTTFSQVAQSWKEGPIGWLSRKDYKGYSLTPSTTEARNPQYYRDDKKTVLSESDLASLNAKDTFLAEYKFSLDKKRYVTVDAVNHSVPEEGILTVTYTVKPIALPDDVPGEILAGTEMTIEYGTTTFVLPDANAAAPGKRDHYALASTTPETAVLIKPSGAAATPEENSAIDVAKVKDYEAGTKFKVSFTYKPESVNYEGKNYKYTFTYAIVSKKLNAPQIPNLPIQTVEFGKVPADQRTKIPAAFVGFDATYLSSQITFASPVNPSGSTLSPSSGTAVDWTKVNLYNSGTKYKLTFGYTPKANYSYEGDPVVVSQEYEIVKQKVTAPADEIKAIDTDSYAFEADPVGLNPPTAVTGFKLESIPVYYDGDKRPAPGTSSITPAQVKKIPSDGSFMAEWTATIDSVNYQPAAPNGPTSYKIYVPYKVGKKAATYKGARTYAGQSIVYQQEAPTEFVPASPLLPEQNGEGYEYKSVAFTITNSATDGSGPAAGAAADLAQVKKYGAGTEITATFTFGPAKDYSGPTIEVTKKLTITRKAIDQPAKTTAGQNPAPFNWGTKQNQPNNPPAAPEGFRAGAYGGAVFTAVGKDKVPADLKAAVDWNKTDTYGVGTIIRVSWTYVPDTSNYVAKNNAELTSVTVTQEYTIAPVVAIKPVGTATGSETDPFRATEVIKYTVLSTEGVNPAHPFPSINTAPAIGGGYQKSSLESVLVSLKKGTKTSDVGTPVNSWDQALYFDFGAEFEAKYKYEHDTNHTGEPVYYVVTYRYEAIPAKLPDNAVADESGFYSIVERIDQVQGTIPNKPFPKPDEPLAPIEQPGYKTTYWNVWIRKNPAGGDPEGSTPVGTWEETRNYPIGVEYEETYRYELQRGYSGVTFAYRILRTIVKAS